MPKYKLTYFNGRGRAELTRLIFAQAGVEYEDNRISREQWQELEPKTPWGGLPVLEYDDKMIGQSLAIARYAARENGLAGTNSIEQCLSDSFIDAIYENFLSMSNIFFEKDEEKKAELVKKFQSEEVPKVLRNIEKIMENNKGGDGFLVGDNVTWADLALLNMYDNIELFTKQKTPFLANKCPKIEALIQRVGKLPNIEKWVKNRPQTSF